VRAFRYQAVIAFDLGCSACTIHPEDRDALDGPERVESTPGVAVPIGAALAAPLNLTQNVNPFIGTDDSSSPNPVPGGAGGSTYPGPVPVRLVQLGPGAGTRRLGHRSAIRRSGTPAHPLRRCGLPQQRGHPHPRSPRLAASPNVGPAPRPIPKANDRGRRVTTAVLDRAQPQWSDRDMRTGVPGQLSGHHERPDPRQHPPRDWQPNRPVTIRIHDHRSGQPADPGLVKTFRSSRSRSTAHRRTTALVREARSSNSSARPAHNTARSRRSTRAPTPSSSSRWRCRT
jgi:hypothetical protein